MKEKDDQGLQQMLVAGDVEVAGARTNAVMQGKRFSARFIVPGLVSYEERNLGISLVRKETIDKYLDTFLDKPVTIEHPARMNSACKYEHTVGKVDKVEYCAKDGWFWCGGELVDDTAIGLVNSGRSVSCGYTIPGGEQSLGKGGRYNRVKYDNEINNLQFNHLAIVTNPRYEEAGIRLNSVVVEEGSQPKEESKMVKLIRKVFGKKDGVENSVEPQQTVEEELADGTTLRMADGSEATVEEIASMKARLNSALEAAADMEKQMAAIRKNAEEKVIKTELTPPAAPVESAPVAPAPAPVVPAPAPAPVAPAPVADPFAHPTEAMAQAVKAAVEKALGERAAATAKPAAPDYFETLRNAQYRVPPVGTTNHNFGTLEEQLAQGRKLFSKAS